MINEILLRRKHKVTIDVNEQAAVGTEQSLAHLLTLELNIGSLGFRLSHDLAVALSKLSSEIIDDIYNELFFKLKICIGADKEYHVMYPNFPNQVAEASDAELWFNALIHYATFGKWLPSYEKVERAPLEEQLEKVELDFGTTDELEEIFRNLLGSRTSLSLQDKEDIEWCLENCECSGWFPEKIPFKETLAWISSKLIRVNTVNANVLNRYYHTATDVLRLVVALSGGDTSLSCPTRFRSLRRKERRLIMSLLNNCSNLQEDMWRNREQWIRVGERLHPGEYKQYKKVNLAFESIREEKKPLFWTGKVETFIHQNKEPSFTEMMNFLAVLMERPGEFARRLDKILREYPNYTSIIMEHFSIVAHKVSTPVLLQLLSHFRNRDTEKFRIVMPKGSVAKACIIPNHSQNIEEITKICTILEEALIKEYSKRSALGKVWIDPALENYIIPFSQRNTNSSYKSMTRGSRLNLGELCERFFIWWTNIKEQHMRVDLDLSMSFYSENWDFLGWVSYTKLKDAGFQCYHSGDIIDGGEFGGEGASEFIDINVEELLKNECRYAVPQVYSYSGQPFYEIPCTFGWMERSWFDSGEIYEPKTVKNQISLTSNTKISVPVIIDCREKQVIWADFSSDMSKNNFINLENNLIGTTAAAYAAVNFKKATMKQVSYLNALARGELVEKMEDADTIFTADKDSVKKQLEKEEKSKEARIITQWDLDVFMSDLI